MSSQPSTVLTSATCIRKLLAKGYWVFEWVSRHASKKACMLILTCINITIYIVYIKHMCYVFTYTKHICRQTYTYVHNCVHRHDMHIYIHTFTCTHEHIHMYTHAYAHMHTYTRAHTHTYVYTCIHTHTHIRIHLHTCTYTHVYTHVYTHTHARIHTQHTHVWHTNGVV